MFTIKNTQKLLRTSGDPAQEMIDSQVMGLEALEEHLMETVVMGQGQTAEQQGAAPAVAIHLMDQGMAQLVAQVLVMETVLTGVIPALVLMVAPVQAMALEATEEHLMDQGMAQLVAQALVMETVLTVAIPAPVLQVAPEAQATEVTVDQGMVQVQATVTEQATAVTALTTVLSLTLLL